MEKNGCCNGTSGYTSPPLLFKVYSRRVKGLSVGVPSNPSPKMKWHNKGGLKGGRVKVGFIGSLSHASRDPVPPGELYIRYWERESAHTQRDARTVIIKVHFLVVFSPNITPP